MQRVFPEMTVFVLEFEDWVTFKAVRKIGNFMSRGKSRGTDTRVEAFCLEKSKTNFCLDKSQALCRGWLASRLKWDTGVLFRRS